MKGDKFKSKKKIEVIVKWCVDVVIKLKIYLNLYILIIRWREMFDDEKIRQF